MILRNDIEISKAKIEDINFLIPLLKLLFSIEKDFIFNEEKHIKGLELLINSSSSLVLIARFEKKIVGMITMQTMISTAVGAKTGLIEDFVVVKNYQNMGIGTSLLSYLKKYAIKNNFERLQLLCDNDNPNAKRFYSKKLFKISNLSAWYKSIII